MITNEYGIEETQTELLCLMKTFDQIMKENNIEYSLAGGTLLGAIRHNGFIPWDDDVDIMFNRYNYEKLLRLFKRNGGVVSTRDNLAKCRIERVFWIYRIKGINIKRRTRVLLDVMVMDNCPDNLILRKLKLLLIKILQGMMHKKIDFNNKTFVMKICLVGTYFMGKLFSDNFKFFLYDKVSQIGNRKKTMFVGGYNDIYKTLHCQYTEKLMDKIVTHSFEDTILPITKEYDNYLTSLYGDYMVLPKEDERMPEHADILL